MTYTLIDETGQSRDIATNAGLKRLRSEATGALAELLDAGEGNDELRVKAEQAAPTTGEWAHVKSALGELSGHVTLTNGMEEGDETL
mgnify:FL=1